MTDKAYNEAMAKRRAAVRSLVDDVFHGFLALDLAGRREVAARLAEHFSKTHPDATRFSLQEDRTDV